MPEIDPSATAWLLASTALVLLMTPGLAIFYGGMVRTTGVLNMIMMSFISGFRVSANDETTGIDFTQHAETAYAEGVHGHVPTQRPSPFGDLGSFSHRPETATEG